MIDVFQGPNYASGEHSTVISQLIHQCLKDDGNNKKDYRSVPNLLLLSFMNYVNTHFNNLIIITLVKTYQLFTKYLMRRTFYVSTEQLQMKYEMP